MLDIALKGEWRTLRKEGTKSSNSVLRISIQPATALIILDALQAQNLLLLRAP